MIGVAEQSFTILGRNAGRAQTARERVTKVVHANPRFASCLLPTIVVLSAWVRSSSAVLGSAMLEEWLCAKMIAAAFWASAVLVTSGGYALICRKAPRKRLDILRRALQCCREQCGTGPHATRSQDDLESP